MGKAKHPHDSSRPSSPAVVRALKAIERGEPKAAEKLKKALTIRQQRFCEEYVLDFAAKAAAIRAGYSPNNAEKQAYMLRMNDGVLAYIDHLTRSRAVKLDAVTPEYVLQGIMEITGKELAKDGDKLRGYELLARHLGMLVDKKEITGKDGGAIQIEKQRVEEESGSFLNDLKRLAERAVAPKPEQK